MPEDVKYCLHAMARRAKSDQGLSFTDSAGTNLDDLYPNDDTDDEYDPDDNDDNQSCESNQSSIASCSNTLRDGTDTPDVITNSRPAIIIQAPTITLRSELPDNHQGNCNPITATPPRTTWATGVGGGEFENYVDRLEAQLDDEIAGLDTTPNTDNENDNQQTDSVDQDTDNKENSTINDNALDDVSVDDAAHTDNKNEEDVTDETNDHTPTVVGGHAL